MYVLIVDSNQSQYKARKLSDLISFAINKFEFNPSKLSWMRRYLRYHSLRKSPCGQFTFYHFVYSFEWDKATMVGLS